MSLRTWSASRSSLEVWRTRFASARDRRYRGPSIGVFTFLAFMTCHAMPSLAQSSLRTNLEAEERKDAIACRQANLLPERKIDLTAYIECKRQRSQRAAVWKHISDHSDDDVECEFIGRSASPDGHVDSELQIACLDTRMDARGDTAHREFATRENEIRMSARYEASKAAFEREQAAEQAAAEKAERAATVRRTKCGDDYMRVAVGMLWSTVSECSGPFRSVGELATAAGTVAQYRSGRALVSVMNGKVVQWLATR